MSERFAIRRPSTSTSVEKLYHATAFRYRPAGRSHEGFVRGKLRYDPMYGELLACNLLPRSGRLVDIGCGRGILLTLIDTARRADLVMAAPSDWVPPSADLTLHGIEARGKAGSTARIALGAAATIEIGDAACHALPSAAAIMLLDVLHYLTSDDQDALLARAVRSLVPGGKILVREADAGPGWRFAVTRAAERLRALGRGQWQPRFGYRSAAEWREILERHGLTVRIQPMSRGTPFDNQLLIAQRAADHPPLSSRRSST